MVEYGGNRPKIEVFTLADEMDVYHFDWSHSLEFFRKYTHITAICNLLK